MATVQQMAREPAKRKLVLVGNGMAGMRAIEELLKLAPDMYDITVFGAEPWGNYNRILLSPVLAAEKAVRDAGKAQSVHVTGLSLPSLMRDYVHEGVVEQFLLWNPVDLGYLTIHVAKRLEEGTLNDGMHDMGRLKDIEVLDGEALLGPPLVFDKNNIDDYEF